jgi:hypothetical protein
VAQIAQRFTVVDGRSNGSHRVSLVYNAASNPNPNTISLVSQSLLPYRPSLLAAPNPYLLFAYPRLPRRRLALSGADTDQAPRLAAPAPAAAGEGPSGSSAAIEDPVLVRVVDDGVPSRASSKWTSPGTPATTRFSP